MNTKRTALLLSGLIGLGAIAGSATIAGASAETGTPTEPAAHIQTAKAARFANLTDDQRQCLTDAGLSRPTGRPSVEQHQALRAAAENCGLSIPERAGRPDQPADRETAQARQAARFANLTDDQRQCLTDAGLSRPTAKPTAETFKALRAAAQDCGIEIPAGAGSHGGPQR